MLNSSSCCPSRTDRNTFLIKPKTVFGFIRWVKAMGCEDINVKDVKALMVSLQLGILRPYYATMILDGK